MYLSRITLAHDASPRDIYRSFGNSGYDHHRFLWRFFSDSADRRRDFLFRRDDARGRPLFYTVSSRPPSRTEGIWDVEAKEYRPRIINGEVLSFLLRANPVRSRRDAARRQLRHDVIMDARKIHEAQGASTGTPIPRADIVQEAASGWLAERAGGSGFHLLDVRADGYMQHRFWKRGAAHPISISTVEFTGTLRVLEAETFVQTLFNGIGHSKGFGCGLLLVRRV